jgi:hypothetical protein
VKNVHIGVGIRRHSSLFVIAGGGRVVRAPAVTRDRVLHHGLIAVTSNTCLSRFHSPVFVYPCFLCIYTRLLARENGS